MSAENNRLPPHLAAALDDVGTRGLPGIVADGLACQGARFHSPTPRLLHEVTLYDGEKVLVCGTCRDNYAVLAHVGDRWGWELPWELRREFGNDLRALALRGEP